MHEHEEVHFPDCRGGERCRCETRRYQSVLAIGVAILIFEVLAGMLTNSLALIADAGHVAVDSVAVGLAIVVSIIVRRRISNERRVRTAGFALAITLLGVIAAWIIIEAIERLWEPRKVYGMGVMIAATLGALGNFWQHRILVGAAEHRTHRALHVHVQSDLLMSVGVVISGAFIWCTEWLLIDPLVSLTIALWILMQIINLIRHPDAHGSHAH